MDTLLLTANVASHWVQSGILAATALLALRALRVKEPRVTLGWLQFVLLLILLLPFMQVWRSFEEFSIISTSSAIAVAESMPGPAAALGISAVPPSRLTIHLTLYQIALVVLVGGIVLRLAWLAYGIFWLMRFGRKAVEVSRPAVAVDLEHQLQISPRYIEQTGQTGPWTFGFFRSTIALPGGFDALGPAFQRAVVGHELLHVKRRDMAVAFAEELAVALIWFHPWVWLLRARIRIAREQVVDRRAVALTGARDEYVRCLVEISGHDLVPHLSQAGAGMLRARELRVRVDAIFQERRMSRARVIAVSTCLTVVVALTTSLTAFTVPMYAPYVAKGPAGYASPVPERAQQSSAAETPRRQIKMGVAEYPADALEKGIVGTVRVAITVGPSGDVTTASVVSGPQELRASAFKAAMGSKYERGPSTTAMTVGVEYRLDNQSWGVRMVSPGTLLADAVRKMRSLSDGTRLTVDNPETNRAGQDASGAVRIGGNIRAPRKVKDVAPVYPPEALQAKVQGVVILEARIDENGNVSNTRVLRSIPLLDQAAIDAVNQWQYTPTLMNGVPVPVTMTMTVNFTLRNGGMVTLKIILPDGTATEIRVGSGGLGTLTVPDLGTFGFAPLLEHEEVVVAIYELKERGVAPQQLGTVQLTPGGVVQSPSTPSFGIELVNPVRRLSIE